MRSNYQFTRNIKLDIASWSTSILMGKKMNLVDVMRSRTIDVACLPEGEILRN